MMQDLHLYGYIRGKNVTVFFDRPLARKKWLFVRTLDRYLSFGEHWTS